MMWLIAFGAAILYTKIILVERQDIDADGGVENFEFGYVFESQGEI